MRSGRRKAPASGSFSRLYRTSGVLPLTVYDAGHHGSLPPISPILSESLSLSLSFLFVLLLLFPSFPTPSLSPVPLPLRLLFYPLFFLRSTACVAS